MNRSIFIQLGLLQMNPKYLTEIGSLKKRCHIDAAIFGTLVGEIPKTIKEPFENGVF